MSTLHGIRKYKHAAGGVCGGLIAACAVLIYERYKINKHLSKLVESNVMDIDKKRPDYIYIKYHIYRESMEKIRMKQQNENWINVIIHPFGKWWKTLKHSVAWRLLNVAKFGDKHDRLKAVRQLAKLDHLKDWDFCHLAQICDARTAVSLARSDCDKRWFRPPFKHGIIKNPKLILNDLRIMMEKLRPCGCIDYFFKKHFDVSQINENDINEIYSQGTPLSTQDTDLLKECVAFLHHITKDVSICKKIVEQGGLQTLQELRKIFPKDNETLATLCKTIANIAVADDCVEDFFVSGWVGILAEWQSHPDVRLQVIAAKALANLDVDDPNHCKYPPNVYPLYPRKRKRFSPKLDVVFIHGLLGGVFITWRQKDRKPNELGLYGKNAFYTNESDDIFLVGETKRNSLKLNRNGNQSTGNKNIDNKQKVRETVIPTEGPVINKRRKIKSKTTGISDEATIELVETLENASELDNDWEVAYPDCPLKSNIETSGKFSVSGDQWINDDQNEEYTNCWPMDWLPEDYPDIRVIGVDYTSAVSHWSANYAKYCPCEKGQGHINTRADFLLERLTQSGVGQNNPVVWIGHSMGGILCKNILVKALDSPDSKVKDLAKNSKAVIFLGTPHRGSSIARWKQHMQMILSPSIEVKELQEGSPKLLELHTRFMKSLGSELKKLQVISIAEGSPTMLTTFKFPLHIVTEESAFINHGDFYVLKDDHLSLSKPIFRQSFLYQRLLKVIDDSMKKKPEPEDTEENHKTLHLIKRRINQNFVETFPGLLYRFFRPFEQ